MMWRCDDVMMCHDVMMWWCDDVTMWWCDDVMMWWCDPHVTRARMCRDILGRSLTWSELTSSGPQRSWPLSHHQMCVYTSVLMFLRTSHHQTLASNWSQGGLSYLLWEPVLHTTRLSPHDRWGWHNLSKSYYCCIQPSPDKSRMSRHHVIMSLSPDEVQVASYWSRDLDTGLWLAYQQRAIDIINFQFLRRSGQFLPVMFDQSRRAETRWRLIWSEVGKKLLFPRLFRDIWPRSISNWDTPWRRELEDNRSCLARRPIIESNLNKMSVSASVLRHMATEHQ